MKKWLGFIAILIALLIPTPVMAISVSPYTASVNVPANSYAELVFNVTGCSSVDLSLEGIPLVVEPNHASVVGGQVTAKILGSLSIPPGTYNGYLVIAESGQQVGAGVKINLTVNHINNQSVILTTTVLQSSVGGYYGGGYGGTAWPTNTNTVAPTTEPIIPPMIVPIPPSTNTINPPAPLPGEPTQPNVPNQLPKKADNSWLLIVIVALALVIIVWLIIMIVRNRKANRETQ